MPSENIKPGTFTVKVPLTEAIQWGKDAILSYGGSGIEIWKPDNSTLGVFQYYSDILGTSFYYYVTNLDGQELRLTAKIGWTPPIVGGICILLLSIIACILAIDNIGKKYCVT